MREDRPTIRRLYSYVGPPDIAEAVDAASERFRIRTADDVHRWLAAAGRPPLTATFIVDAGGDLWIADRRSEHVACARGGPVLSAGEMSFDIDGNRIVATYVTNQSTGFCPEPESWPSVAEALDRAGIGHSGGFDMACQFRRCACGQINLVKDGLFECAVCGAELAAEWNLDAG
ncbi:hypothetical protein Mal4_57500 [Maioricimonas rarisocia]|uniref:Uncharacterized protein n=1 Tax=Maioricimonas rarisocia TaxID=2528026 RepID=A0A517ZFW4_9PLAN|nr:hypothetical protein [Maioricimonas rarisocia]QDU41383.1 hypothetical protein Mal4_57500 [Maioricimonas rarisocia]